MTDVGQRLATDVFLTPVWEMVAHIGQTNVNTGNYASASGTPHVGHIWWLSCGSIQGMIGNTAAEGAVIKLVMGDNIDYFRPAASFTLCEMLGSNERHEWSNDMVTWVTPAYYNSHLGGSANMWPSHNVAEDNRDYLSFWGATNSYSGCCHSTKNDGAQWNKRFDIYVQVNNVVLHTEH
jgi:hypothetical protein